jgi:hypothetical protein
MKSVPPDTRTESGQTPALPKVSNSRERTFVELRQGLRDGERLYLPMSEFDSPYSYPGVHIAQRRGADLP